MLLDTVVISESTYINVKYTQKLSGQNWSKLIKILRSCKKLGFRDEKVSINTGK